MFTAIKLLVVAAIWFRKILFKLSNIALTVIFTSCTDYSWSCVRCWIAVSGVVAKSLHWDAFV